MATAVRTAMAPTSTLIAASTRYARARLPVTCSAAIQNSTVEATAAHENVKAQVAKENLSRIYLPR